MDPIAVIYRYYNNASTTDTYYKVVSYILRHLREIPQLSITELAEKTYTSQATISRFVRMIGLENFRDFRQYFDEVLHSSKNSFLRMSPSTLSVVNTQPQTFLSEYTGQVIDALEDLRQTLRFEDVDELIHRVDQAENTALLGFSDSLQVAKDIQLGYLVLGKAVEVAESQVKMKEVMTRYTSRDLVIILSNYGNFFAYYQSFYQHLSTSGIPLVLITQNYNAMDMFGFVQTIFLSSRRHLAIGNYPMRVFSDYYVRRLLAIHQLG
ncbi:MAG: MurR/RpiR family transcriptional regulator [Schleiferilactobacillus harbinensis]|jgi:DNA-binding MurR/RpiR family transcriptional regulator|nr:MurR/RpiR family transcriptional regulator [Schleiferilactobacillus harbinensis]MCI1911419.1 MurR/RpiR family transcriptional regulator [Schleiferilactobacillus harbinensis]